MDSFKIEMENSPDEFEIIPIYDIHIGARAYRNDILRKVIARISENGSYFFLGGDLAEFIAWKDNRFEPGGLDPDFTANLDKIIDYSIDVIVDIFSPVKEKCLFMISGNHDLWFYRRYGVDVVGRIAEGLGVKNYTRSMEALTRITLKWCNRSWTFDIYAHHGFGGGRKKGALINNLEDLSGYFDADIYVLGHSHQLLVSTKRVLALNRYGTGITEKEKLLIRVGGFRDSRSEACSYEEKTGKYPNALGTVAIRPIRDLFNRRYVLRFTAEIIGG